MAVKFPLGLQHFSKIRKEGFLYIDKTKWIYRLVKEGSAYFLSRPRRFGKSLLISTLEALFLGKQDLFSGLWIDKSDYEWKEFPVIRLDLSKVVSSSVDSLATSLQELLNEVAIKYEISGIKRPFPSLTLSALVIELFKRGPVVILIDEYDKPLVHHLENTGLAQQNRDLLRDFYATIKALDQYLRFVFVTGVSKFSKVSLFSGMNNLREISLYDAYADLLGITEEEISSYLLPEIAHVANKKGKTQEDILTLLRTWYNGYRYSLSPLVPKVYNPVSLFSYLETSNLDNYWFTTATPTFAIELIKIRSFPVIDFENGVIAGKEIEVCHDVDVIDIPTLLFQTGYLTIGDYDEKTQTFFLKFPNEEVRRSFLEHLLHAFTASHPSEIHGLLYKLSKHLEDKDLESFFDVFNVFLSSVPHQIHKDLEAYYHSLLYLFLKAIGFRVEAEISTAQGRIDMLLKTKTTIFLFEFKVNKTAQEALNQILNKDYQKRFSLSDQIILVGVNFDTQSRTLNEWKSLSLN